MILDEQNAENLKNGKGYTKLFGKTYETKCLIIHPDKSWSDDSFFNVDEIEFISDQNDSGVFETLRRKYKDDIREHVYIAAPFDLNAIHLTGADYNITAEYLHVFIKAGRLSITGYRITDKEKNIRSWILVGSNNQTDWTTLDEHTDYKMTDVTEYFDVKVRNPPLFKYFRLKHVGMSWSNDSSRMRICHFDMFGSYLPDM